MIHFIQPFYSYFNPAGKLRKSIFTRMFICQIRYEACALIRITKRFFYTTRIFRISIDFLTDSYESDLFAKAK